jgi:hypothetical protein
MDELFRKAAAGYPLKTDNSDWDSLASRLLTPIVPAAADQKKTKFKKYGPPLLLVLLMLVLGEGSLKQKRNYSTVYPPAETTKQQQSSQRQLNNKRDILYMTDHEPNGQLRSDGNNPHSIIKSTYDQTTNTGVDKPTGKNVSTIPVADLAYDTEKPAIASKIAMSDTNVALNKNTIGEAQETIKKKIDSIPRPSKIYWGIVFGPGINRVKKQKLQKPGFDIGIMAGISILKGRAAIETGLLYTQKYYFSDGKYFNMDKDAGSMPQGMEVMSLEGSSRLFELPVKIRYSVLQKNKSGVSLSTGISSYLMTKEENDYLTMMNGSEQSMVGSYKDHKRYIAVMANIGAEFNYIIGKHSRLSIEPYFQIPLKGIGIGSMPVMTTGIHFGFMRFTP